MLAASRLKTLRDQSKSVIRHPEATEFASIDAEMILTEFRDLQRSHRVEKAKVICPLCCHLRPCDRDAESKTRCPIS